MNPQVYILDDDATFAELLRANLGRAGEFRSRVFTDPREFLEATAETRPDAVLTDLHMPGVSGIEVTRSLRAESLDLPIFVLTSDGELESAIEALKAGASEYITKPVNVSELTTLLRKALADRPLIEEARSARARQKKRYSSTAMLGAHPRVDEARAFVERLAGLPTTTVLLLGESGTGKNLAARAIHFTGPSTRGRFVEVNCAALPPHLLEAELFGYMKGAFTDARENKTGLAELADGGTLFLDEIGELPLELQVKLLSFLESRTFRRLGGTREIDVQLRLIAATNRDLERAVAEGRFREDLYYRISVATQVLPPLREVMSDLPLLAHHLATDLAREAGRAFSGFTPGALERLGGWHWPGNVRELRNVIERALLFSTDGRIDESLIPPLTGPDASPPVGSGGSQPNGGGADEVRLPHGLTLGEVERSYIERALAFHGGQIAATADSLGISRKNLWEKRKRHGLLG
ncbi:sigma-54-dependent transcriptional regulator [Gaopeijia maritima]|uniref:Sigma-54 dependent transcriptional regulator n=1 Tax=Gaopeijia maritima TaxID=3119007 RepID=A0ABU9EBL4_9BACT